MKWSILLNSARISRDLLSCGNDVNTVISCIEMGLIDNDKDEELCPHLRWEINRLQTWNTRKPFMNIPEHITTDMSNRDTL